MKGHYSYPPWVALEFVDIPQSVVDFFKRRCEPSQRGHYIALPKKDEDRVAITYKGVVGENAEEVPSELYSTYGVIEHIEEFSFSNLDDQSKQNADVVTVATLKALFGNGHYDNVKKAYMVGTSTTPIKVNFKEKGKKSKKVMFVKRPSTNRIVGRFFYDIISGVPGIRYAFNRAVFLEEGIHGNTLSKINEKVYLHLRDYKEGLVKAAVHAEFLGLDKDVSNPRNRIIDSQMRTILFDFDLMLNPRKPGEFDYLLEDYIGMDEFFDAATVYAYLEEQRSVARRVESNQRCFFKMARIAGTLVDATGKTLDAKVNESYGARTLEEYFERKVVEFRQV